MKMKWTMKCLICILPSVAKKVCERMVLEENIHILLGGSGANIQKINNQAADQFKVIPFNFGSEANDLQNVPNFSRYSFMGHDTPAQVGMGMYD